YQAHHKKENPYVTLLPVSDFAAVLIILWQRTFGNGVSCKTGAGRADVAVQVRAGLPLPCIFHLSTFFRSLQILRFAKIYPFPKRGQTVIIRLNGKKRASRKTMRKKKGKRQWKKCC